MPIGLIVLLAAIYALISTRIGYILHRSRREAGEETTSITIVIAVVAVWPLTAFSFGLIMLLTGEGLFKPRRAPQPRYRS